MGSVPALAALLLGVSMVVQAWGFIVPDQNAADVLILVNKQNKAPIVPMELVRPDVPPVNESVKDNIYMRPVAAEALEALFAEAKEQGLTLYARSGYRSYSTQKAIYKRKLESTNEQTANKVVAKAGYSEHQTGLAMDIEGETSLGHSLNQSFAETPEGIWVYEHCDEFGFIIRYPKGKTAITGYVYEPWHLRYVGVDVAKEITEKDITFEEYILQLKQDRIRYLEGDAAEIEN